MNRSVACFCVLGVAWLGGCAPQGTMIMTQPPRAEIYLNNRLEGRSPLTLKAPLQEDLEIRASKDGCDAQQFFKYEAKAPADPKSRKKRPNLVLPEMVYLTLKCPPRAVIVTDPQQAEIFVNDKRVGEASPVIFSGEENADIEVKVTKGPYSQTRHFTMGKAAKFGAAPPELRVTLSGQLEVGAFRVGAPEEQKDLDTAMAVLNTLKNPSSTIVIYDASGSMRWPLSEGDKTPRFEPGQRAIKDFVAKVSPDDHFGLLVFGHRLASGAEGSEQRSLSCQDIEPVVPLQKMEKKQVLSAISVLGVRNHKGDTPLEQAIMAAVELLKGRAGDKKIVLVTDGEDECGGHPERAAQEAAKSGIKVHTMAFGIGISKEGTLREQKAQEVRGILKDCADASGGLFFDTKGAEELLRAMVRVELAVFTYSVRDSTGKEVLVGGLGQRAFLDPGTYDVVFNTDRPLSQRVEIKPARSTKIFIALSKEGAPEIRTVLE